MKCDIAFILAFTLLCFLFCFYNHFHFNHRYGMPLLFICFSDMCKYVVICGVPILKANTNLYAFSIWQCLFYTGAGIYVSHHAPTTIMQR